VSMGGAHADPPTRLGRKLPGGTIKKAAVSAPGEALEYDEAKRGAEEWLAQPQRPLWSYRLNHIDLQR
jgi:hypothetical protein